jgi:hypothetical protein
MKRRLDQYGPFAERIRRSSREIVVAAVLTVAAFAFLLAAVIGGVPGTTEVGHIAAEEQTIK